MNIEKTIFHLSGLPTTGKSTLIAALKQEFLGSSVLFVPEFFEKIPNYVLQADSANLERKCKAQRWIIDQNKRKNQLILDCHSNLVISERGIIDAFAFSYALGQGVYQDSLSYAGTESWLSGITIFLVANERTIKERLFTRDGVTEKIWKNYWQPYFKRVIVGYRQAKKTIKKEKFIYINTEKEQKQSIVEVTQLIKTIQLVLSR